MTFSQFTYLKEAVFLAVLFERFFFFADKQKKGLLASKKPLFLRRSVQKRTTLKEPVKRTADLVHVNRLLTDFPFANHRIQ